MCNAVVRPSHAAMSSRYKARPDLVTEEGLKCVSIVSTLCPCFYWYPTHWSFVIKLEIAVGVVKEVIRREESLLERWKWNMN